MLALQNNNSWILHHLRNCLVISFSVILLPISALVTLIAFVLRQTQVLRAPRQSPNKDGYHTPRILVTGVGMTKGLFLARTMYLGGCEVFGADFSEPGNLPCGRFSSSIQKFFTLKSPKSLGPQAYISQVIQIIIFEKIDMWISCSGVATAVEDARLARAIREKTTCKTFQFDEDTIITLDDKLKFMRKTSELQLANIEWCSIGSGEELSSVINYIRNSSAEVKFMIKSASVDDTTRGSLPLLSPQNLEMAEQVLLSLDYTEGRQWILQEYIESGEEYCTQAVLVRGKVRAFTACPSSSVLMHYRPLDVHSILYQKMLNFTQDYATGLGNNPTGHISFDFLVRHTNSEDGFCASIVPIECNPRCHTAVVMFEKLEVQLADRYLEALDGADRGDILKPIHHSDFGFYWIAHDVVVLLLASIFDLILANDQSRPSAIREILNCVEHLLIWRDPVFLWWDPLPWFVLNHLYWPLKLVMASWHRTRWRQLNVSTGKIFGI